MKSKIFIASLLISFFTLTSYNYIVTSKEKEIQNSANKALDSLSVATDAILGTYKVAALQDWNFINKDQDVMALLQEFQYANNKQKNLLRGRLYRLLYKDYELMQTFNLRQLQFHTKKGESLLRFHEPHLNGDSLMDIRNSIKNANTKFESFSGFEGGRVLPAFRYVFPLFYNKEHLGSVEFSVAFEAIESKLKNILPFYAHKIIYKKAISLDRVFQSYRSYFEKSDIDENYYVENSAISRITGSLKNDTLTQNLSALAKKSAHFETKLSQCKSFALPIISENKGYVVTFLNILDSHHHSAAYIVSFGHAQDIITITQTYKVFIFVLFLSSFMLFGSITTVIIQLQRLKDESSKLTKFIDIQDSIVILTDGKKFKFANKKFFDFLAYKDLKAFTQEHSCICELFIKNNGFFTLENVQKDEAHWVESLLNRPGRNRIVSMLDTAQIPHAFSVSINKYDEENYVLNFSDISDTMSEKLQLQREVIIDQLTKAYNRAYFKKTITTILEHHKEDNHKTGVIFFDIDHFKDVNDTYGHDIGDEVLKNVVQIAKHNIRNSDKLIRWGGEEFLIILPIDSLEELIQIAENLRTKIQNHPFDVVQAITCSFGVILHQTNEDISASVKKSDEKLYEAKESGRNRVVY